MEIIQFLIKGCFISMMFILSVGLVLGTLEIITEKYEKHKNFNQVSWITILILLLIVGAYFSN
jgi:NhaP-type Na+/H+ or K+/H+ antiporter